MSGLIVAPWQADDRPTTPDGFVLCAATFAAQVESPEEPPARGPDASDRWRQSSGGAGFLTRHAEDLRLAKELGFGAVSFSLAWARVVPGGRGRPRREALDAYARVAEAAEALGLRVVVTLWHHDLPQELGSWAGDGVPERFAELAEQAGVRLGHHASFVTLHEPGVLMLPGPRAASAGDAHHVREARGLARAHALAMQALRATCAAPVGLALDLVSARSLGRVPEDAPAARFAEAARTTAWLHVAAGRRGELLRAPAAHGADGPVRAQLLGAVDAAECAACDFVVLRPAPGLRVASRRPAAFDLQAEPAAEALLEEWMALVAAWKELAPAGGGPVVHAASRHAGTAGLASEEPDPRTGRIDDGARAGGLERASEQWRLALAAGVPVAGWVTGLLDGFELEEGLGVRTGLVHVDRARGERRLKASGERFRRLAEAWS